MTNGCGGTIRTFALLGVTLAAMAVHAAPPTELVLQVPGFADFLAIDHKAVWATNRGRVERWSRDGKSAEVPMTRPCGAMTIAAGSLWVADCAEGTVNRIDLKTVKTSATIKTGIANPKGELNVASGAGSIWVGNDAKGTIARVDRRDNRIIASVPVDPDTFYLSFGFGHLWAVSATQQTLQKIDPRTNTVVKRIAIGKQPGFLIAGEGAVWVQEQGDGTVVRVDPKTGEISGRVQVDTSLKYGDIDAGGGKVWLRTTAGQTFVVIDPKSLAILARVGGSSGSGALRYTHAGLWTSAHDLHTLSWWERPKSIGGKAMRGAADPKAH